MVKVGNKGSVKVAGKTISDKNNPGKTDAQKSKYRNLVKVLGSEALAKRAYNDWKNEQDKLSAPDPVAVAIEKALEGGGKLDSKLSLGNYGYTIKRTRGKKAGGWIIEKNDKPSEDETTDEPSSTVSEEAWNNTFTTDE